MNQTDVVAQEVPKSGREGGFSGFAMLTRLSAEGCALIWGALWRAGGGEWRVVSGWRIRGRGPVTWRRAVDCRRHERRERRGATRGKTPKVIINVETSDDSRNRPSNARSGAPVEVARSDSAPRHTHFRERYPHPASTTSLEMPIRI
jgi:hypothetical protein